MTGIGYDLRQAVRTLARMPGTTVLSVATLAFGIAAATTTFSAVYAAVFRPIPFQDADRLLYLHTTRQTARAGTVLLRWSLAKADALRGQARSFEAIATYTRSYVGISVPPAESSGGTGNAEQIDCEVVGAGYFDVLKVAPALGRVFTAEEEAPGHAVVVLGHALWKRQFGGDPAALGRTLLVNAVPLTIVGVMPAGFEGVSGHAAFWWPRGMAPQLTYREYLTTPQHFLNLIARLRPGVTLAQANAELAALGPGLPMTADPNADPARWSATAIPLGEARVDTSQRRALMLLLAGGGCVLLVTCVNVAMLLLTRARARRGEMAIRLALGAARGRLVQHLLVESALIAAAGGALGVLFAGWGIAWLRQAAPAVMPSPQNNYGQVSGFATPSMDGTILLFVALVALATTMVFGVAPALSASGADPADTLAVSSRGVAGRGRGRALTVLVTSQIAVAVLLLGGALLLAGTVSRLQSDQSGFDNSALTFWINAPASRYADEDGPQVVERMLERIGRVPGVTEAAVNRCTPYGASCARTVLFFPGRPVVPAAAPVIGRHYVSARYFHALGITLRRGRLLTDEDRQGRPPVTVINETAARRFWPNEDPIGKRVWFGSAPGFTDPARPVEVVGVVSDVKYLAAERADRPRLLHLLPAVHLPLVVVRGEGGGSGRCGAGDPPRRRRDRSDAADLRRATRERARRGSGRAAALHRDRHRDLRVVGRGARGDGGVRRDGLLGVAPARRARGAARAWRDAGRTAQSRARRRGAARRNRIVRRRHRQSLAAAIDRQRAVRRVVGTIPSRSRSRRRRWARWRCWRRWCRRGARARTDPMGVLRRS